MLQWDDQRGLPLDAVTLSLQRVRSTKTKVHNTTGNKGYYYARKKNVAQLHGAKG